MKEMRRKDRQASEEDAWELLGRCEYGILSTSDDEGPYGIPLDYVVEGNSLYFHCAMEGRKVDALLKDNRVSFCAVGNTEVMSDKFATRYECVIATGKAFIVEGEEKKAGLRLLLEKYSPQHIDAGLQYIERSHSITRVFRIELKHISCKARR